MSIFVRLTRVSSFFAEITHQMTARRYDAGCASKNFHPALFLRTIASYGGVSCSGRCWYE